ncbi:hypothetical protein [Pseudosulfitobacter sp. DSM 107133]|uniref:hypothetical protein n=1 Tax=Pseudosulfitobacter sp. DSM 107133 TaxID=2883100 RepID=UPI0013B3A621|nr:hypothetical protein [Pseudosulfitobacter sp. DSM 107133]
MKKLKYLALILALTSSLVMNVATVAFSSFALAVSAVFEAVTGTSAVASELRRRSTMNERQIKDLKVDLDAKERRSAKLTGELAQVKQRASSLSNDLAVSETKRKALTEDMSAKRKQVSALTDDLAVRDRRIAQLSATINNPQVTYRSQRRPLNQAVEDTVGRITKRTAFGAKRNVAAIFGEGLPVVGVGVAVAVTGYELKDNCDNLKDLRELELSINPSLASPEGVTEVCGLQVPSKAEVWSTVSNSPSTAWATTKEYMPNLGELHLPDISGGWEKAKDGGEFLWTATKDTGATMKLGLDYNIRMLQEFYRGHTAPE